MDYYYQELAGQGLIQLVHQILFLQFLQQMQDNAAQPFTPYDKICLEVECIAGNQALYRYLQEETRHTGHRTQRIHVQDISRILKVSSKTIFATESMTDPFIQFQKTTQTVLEHLKNFFSKPFIQTINSKINHCRQQVITFQKLTVYQIVDGLTHGKQAFLKLVKLMSQKDEQNLQYILAQLLNRQEIKLRSYLDRLEDIVKQLMSQCSSISQTIHGPQPAELQLIINKILQHSKEVVKCQTSPLQNRECFDTIQKDRPQLWRSDQFIKSQDNSSSEKSRKSKKIRKRNRKDIASCSKPTSNHNFKAKPTVLKIDNCRSNKQWLQILKDNQYQEVEEVNICIEQYTTQEKILSILQALPNVVQISFNCRFHLHMEKPTHQLLSRLKNVNIDFKWNLSKFITQYFQWQYFDWRNVNQRQNHIYQCSQNLQMIIFNQTRSRSLWIYYQAQLEKLKLHKYEFKDINTLNIICQFKSEKLDLLEQITALRVLVLKGIKFSTKKESEQSKLSKLIENNKSIETFILEQATIQKQTLDKVLQALKQLKNLRHLSIYLDQQKELVVDPILVFSHMNLQLLSIRYIKFDHIKPDDSHKINWAHITNRLKFLNLYECYQLPIYFVTEVLNRNKQSVTHLQIGSNIQFRDGWLQSIKPLLKLKCLSLDSTKITAKSLVETLESMQNDGSIQTIQYLGLDKTQDTLWPQITQQDLNRLAEILPNLTCLSINYQKTLKSYNFEKFKKLMYLLVDKKLKQRLEKRRKYQNIRIVIQKVRQRYRSQ